MNANCWLLLGVGPSPSSRFTCSVPTMGSQKTIIADLAVWSQEDANLPTIGLDSCTRNITDGRTLFFPGDVDVVFYRLR